jgi:hypothetical protein
MKTTREPLVFPASDRAYPNRSNNVVSSAKEKSAGRDSSRLTIFSFLLKNAPALKIYSIGGNFATIFSYIFFSQILF